MKVNRKMKKMNNNLAAIHGYLCGDGYISSKDVERSIRFSNIHLKLVEDFKRRIERLFEIKRRITIKKVKNKKDLYCYCATKKEVYTELIKYEPYSTENWKIPIKLLDKEGLSLWLRAFFDSEGWLQLTPHQTRTVAACSLNHDGLLQIQKVLKENFDIPSVVKKRRTKNISYIIVCGKENHIKFQDEIGFLHKDKRKKLKEIVNSYVVHEWQFPREEGKFEKFVRGTIRKKARLKRCKGKPKYIRLFSIVEKNLQELSKALYELYKIRSKVYRSVNGRGTVYYELSIQDVDSITKLLENKLLCGEIKDALSLQNSYRR